VRLAPLGVPELTALIDGDADAAGGLVGASWPRPLAAPPLVDEHLELFRDRLRAEGPDALWWNWAIVERVRGEVAGMIGLGGPPGEDGAVEVGYTLYEAARGRGLASAALRLVVPIALAQPGVEIVRATVPPDNVASLRVAERAGLGRAGSRAHPELGTVVVLEIRS
jgi:RimJ/RimL family protein N-acetyltransferase